MADNDENQPADEGPGFTHRALITTEGIYDGLINGVSSLGYLVDAVNHAPMVLNILPGEQNFSTFSDRPFLGHDMIYDTLNGGYEGYKNLTGVVVPDPVDTTDHILYGAGELTGEAATIVATGGVLKAGTVAATEFNAAAAGLDATATRVAVDAAANTKISTTIANAMVDRAGNPTWLGTAANWMERGVASVTKWAAGLPLRHPFMTAATAVSVDMNYNNGALTGDAAKGGANFVAEQFGLGQVFGDSANPDGQQGGLLQDPARLAGMGVVTLALTSMLKDMLGTPLALIAGIAISMFFGNQIGNLSHSIAQGVGLENKPGQDAAADPAAAVPTDRQPTLPSPGM